MDEALLDSDGPVRKSDEGTAEPVPAEEPTSLDGALLGCVRPPEELCSRLRVPVDVLWCVPTRPTDSANDLLTLCCCVAEVVGIPAVDAPSEPIFRLVDPV